MGKNKKKRIDLTVKYLLSDKDFNELGVFKYSKINLKKKRNLKKFKKDFLRYISKQTYSSFLGYKLATLVAKSNIGNIQSLRKATPLSRLPKINFELIDFEL